jgi:hypothetical protein
VTPLSNPSHISSDPLSLRSQPTSPPAKFLRALLSSHVPPHPHPCPPSTSMASPRSGEVRALALLLIPVCCAAERWGFGERRFYRQRYMSESNLPSVADLRLTPGQTSCSTNQRASIYSRFLRGFTCHLC